MSRALIFGLLEVAMVLLVAVGFASWVAPGCGLVVGGLLGLALVTVAQMPKRAG